MNNRNALLETGKFKITVTAGSVPVGTAPRLTHSCLFTVPSQGRRGEDPSFIKMLIPFMRSLPS